VQDCHFEDLFIDRRLVLAVNFEWGHQRPHFCGSPEKTHESTQKRTFRA